MPPKDNNADKSRIGRASTTSNSLIERVQADDPESWRRIVNLYAPLVDWWCRQWCRQRGLYGPRAPGGPDIVQEVFVTVVGKIKTFRKDEKPGTFRCWLRRITENKLREYGKRIRRQPLAMGGSSFQDNVVGQIPAPDLGDEEPDPSDPELDSLEEDLHTVRKILGRRALELLRDNPDHRTTWEAVWEVVVEERCVQDVAKEFKMTVSAVRTARCRVLSHLRQMLEEEYEEFLT
jgi:RNA polymerase sigma-70 factor (ECF subfamily)